VRFSVVIPAYNEELYLPRLLDSLDVARKRYAGGADEIEIIVADNGSTDATARIASGHGCIVQPVEKRVIAAARNGGASRATGDLLCFVDADMRVHPDSFNVIEVVMSRGRVIAGATGVTPERWSLGFAVTYAMLVPIVVLMRMDTGMVFCFRDDFEAIGGYDESLLFAEDVNFLFRMRSRGRKRKQKLFRATRAKAIASLRKFDQHGEWHYFSLMWRVLKGGLGRGKGTRELADDYWYKPRR
jgi:glycosyltransferase involved in cell wall biosynthesis